MLPLLFFQTGSPCRTFSTLITCELNVSELQI